MTPATDSPAAEAHRRNAALGIAFMVGGATIFSVNDLAIKALSGDYPLHEVILVRSIVALAFILAFIPASRQSFRLLTTRRPLMQLARVVIVMISNATYFLGLAALPLATAQAIGFAAPLIMTVLSVFVLGERVGLHRWSAVIAGLIGVVIMLRPEGAGAVQAAAVMILVSAACYAVTQTMARLMRETESAVTNNFMVHLGFVALSLAMGLWAGDGHMAGSADPSLAFLFRAWAWPPLADWPFFLVTGLSVGIGGLLVGHAYRTNEAALVAPFEYTAMPLAVFWGLVFFGTFPDLQGWIGTILICGAGLYTLWRETRRRRQSGH